MRSVLLTMLFAIVAVLAGPASTAELLPASLSADRITYSGSGNRLSARGHVEIYYQGLVLKAEALTYDGPADTITAEGPLILADGDQLTIVADYTELSSDLKRAMLKSARMVLNRQLQMTAVEINRVDGKYTQLFKAAASACVVSETNPNPLWQIRARRIIHDEDKKRIYFQNASLKIGRVPVFWLPYLRVPDPTVQRASGFLVPTVTSSDTRGFGVTAPYFLTLGDYSDVTLTPTLYAGGSMTLGYDYRRRFRNGELDITGAVSRDAASAWPLRAFVFATRTFRFANGFRADLNIEAASDTSYLSDHNFSDKARLDSHVGLWRAQRQSYFAIDIDAYRSLRTTIPDDTIPYLLTGVEYSRRLGAAPLGGQLTLDTSIATLTRRSTTDITGRDVRKASAGATWRRNDILSGGLMLETTAALDAEYYGVAQDSTYPAPITRATPLVAADLSLPMMRARGNGTETLTPRLQLVWSRPSTTAVPNDDSLLVDYEASNIFSLNHQAGQDAAERGLRANVGFTYSRETDDGTEVDAAFGRVFRFSDPGQFTAASGLGGSVSSYAGAFRIALPNKLKVTQRVVFDGGFQLSKNETRIGYFARKFDLSSTHLWLIKDSAGNTVSDRSEWLFDMGYNHGNHWRTEANWRYDLMTSSAANAGLALTYRNDCIKVDLSLSRNFTHSSNVSASTSVGLLVSLEGFGNRTVSGDAGTKCSDF